MTLEAMLLFCMVSFLLGGISFILLGYWFLVKFDQTGQVAQIILKLPRCDEPEKISSSPSSSNTIYKRSRRTSLTPAGPSASLPTKSSHKKTRSTSDNSKTTPALTRTHLSTSTPSLGAVSPRDSSYFTEDSKIAVDVHVKKSGWVQLKKTLPGVFQKRWCELSTDGWISFYRKRHVECLGHIKLKGCCVEAKSSKNHNLLEIFNPNTKKALFRANKKRSILIQGEKEHLLTEKTSTVESLFMKTQSNRCVLKVSTAQERQDWLEAIDEALHGHGSSLEHTRNEKGEDAQRDAGSDDEEELFSEEDRAAISSFKKEVGSEFNAEKYTDEDCLRFLKARQMDVGKAASMFTQYSRWKEEERIDELTAEDVESELSKHKLVLHGRDKNGLPCVLFYPGRHNPKEADPKKCLKLAVFILDQAINHAGPGISKFCVICDCRDFSLSKLDRDLARSGAGILQNYYPERLGGLYVIDPPMVVNVVWKFVKTLLDSTTRQKVQFIRAKDLFNYFEPSQVLESMGGDSTYTFDGISQYGLETIIN